MKKKITKVWITGATGMVGGSLKKLLKNKKNLKIFDFLERGSDERQYCAPGVDLPVCSIMRTKYAEYPEYHTSDDNLNLVSPDGLQGSFNVHIDMIRILEANQKYVTTCLGEPQLGRRNLRSNLGAGKGLATEFKNISNFLAYADGNLDLVDIANITKVYALDLLPIVDKLLENNLIRLADTD